MQQPHWIRALFCDNNVYRPRPTDNMIQPDPTDLAVELCGRLTSLQLPVRLNVVRFKIGEVDAIAYNSIGLYTYVVGL
jgi:hypothetical protein